jgi:superfamily I DNA and/or RNA helicase
LTLTIAAKDFKERLNKAIQREYEVAKARSFGDKKNQLLHGVFQKNSGGNYVYSFQDMSGTPPEEGMKVAFTVEQKSAPGKYLGEVESQFLFEVENDFGKIIPLASITSDPLFLIEKQVEILKEDSYFENQVALASIGIGESPAVDACNPKTVFAEELNLQQKNALQVAGSMPITYIWGPPGTGKTTTMGSIVAALAELNKRVLLISNTNLAVDTALERCLDRYSLVEEVQPGLMLRFGKPVKPEIIEKYGTQIDLDGILAKAIEPIQKEILKQTRTLQKIKDELEVIETEKQEFKFHADSTRLLNKAEKELESTESSLNEIKKSKPVLKTRIKELEIELKESEAKNAISRIFSSKRNPGQIRTEIDQISRDLEQKGKSEKRLQEAIPLQKREIESLTKSATESIEWLKRNPTEKHIENRRTTKLAEQAEIQKTISNLQEQINGKKKELLEKARVIACTAYKPLIDKEISGMQFDAVVVDEASMIPLSLYFCIAARAKERLIIAGDFRQLPPIVNVGNYVKDSSQAQMTIDREFADLLTKNPFTISNALDGIGTDKESKNLVALRDQYRMRKEISNLISDFFYAEHTLRTVQDKRDKSTPWGNETFILFDTSSLNPESSRVDKSWRNIIHSLVIKAISDELIEDGWKYASTSKKSFAILVPFVKQRNVIKSLIEQSGVSGFESGISTVHSFQGNERDLMIVDITKVSSAEEPSLGNFLGNIDPLSKENAIWNVGLSRARQHVIIVADFPTLEKNSSAIISQLVHKMRENCTVIDASSILNEDSVETLQSIADAAPGSLAWYTGESFYKAFEKDLKKAKERVLIASPFTAADRASKWEPSLRDLVANKVDIRILTKPLNEKNNYEESLKIHNTFRTFVSELKEIPKMHEKLSVIDGTVIWLGSLNILSHSKASELMVRIESPDFAKGIMAEYDREAKLSKLKPLAARATRKGSENDLCERPGCNGKYVLKHRRSDNKPFLSCSNWKKDGSGCSNTKEVA